MCHVDCHFFPIADIALHGPSGVILGDYFMIPYSRSRPHPLWLNWWNCYSRTYCTRELAFVSASVPIRHSAVSFQQLARGAEWRTLSPNSGQISEGGRQLPRNQDWPTAAQLWLSWTQVHPLLKMSRKSFLLPVGRSIYQFPDSFCGRGTRWRGQV